MKRDQALGVALVAALSGSLLIGCTSDNATTATAPSASTPVGDPELVGKYWGADGPGVGLNLLYPGKWTARSWGWLEGQGTYKLDGDTITWHGGIECADTEEGTYTYTVQDGRFIQTVQKDPCDRRRESFDGVVFTRVSPPTEDMLTMDNVAKRLAGAGLKDWREAWPEGNQRGWNCGGDTWRSRYSDSAVIVVVDGVTFVIDDPDLDPDTVSEILGGPVTPLKEYCAAG